MGATPLPSPTDPDCERAHRTGTLATQTNCFTLNKPVSAVVASSAAARALDRTNKSFLLISSHFVARKPAKTTSMRRQFFLRERNVA